MSDVIAVVREPRSWAVKHNADFLGRAPSREQALSAAEDLIAWIAARGGRAELRLDEADDRSSPPA